MIRAALWLALGAAAAGGATACVAMTKGDSTDRTPLDRAARHYVSLVGALAAHDPDTLDVDGAAPLPLKGPTLSLAEIAAQAGSAAAALRATADADTDAEPQARGDHEYEVGDFLPNVDANAAADADANVDADADTDAVGDYGRRRDRLTRLLDAVAARAEFLSTRPLPFAEELRRTLGLELPSPDSDDPAAARRTAAALERAVPGDGPLAARVAAFDAQFLIPSEHLPAAFERSLAECRSRTVARLALPAGESVEVRYVTGRPWSGFSRYLGDGRSVLEVNTGFPLTPDRVLDLACHEGYPGHHVLSVLRDNATPAAWPERGVLPLHSPESYLLEAAASMASDIVFDSSERLAFERDVLFPLAGLDGRDAERYVAVSQLLGELQRPLGLVVARYLAGHLDTVEASWALRAEALMAEPLATLQFINQYRGYALAYTLGRESLEPLLGSRQSATVRLENLVKIATGNLSGPGSDWHHGVPQVTTAGSSRQP